MTPDQMMNGLFEHFDKPLTKNWHIELGREDGDYYLKLFDAEWNEVTKDWDAGDLTIDGVIGFAKEQASK